MSRRRPLVIAHRGASSEAPENTAAAVRRAVAVRADGVECDVQLSRDGVPIVFHDDDLRRLCGVRGRVAQCTAAELQRLRVRVAGRELGTAATTRILTLAQWLRRLPRGVLPVVELKRQRTAARERQLAHGAARLLAGRRGAIAVISFSPRLVALAAVYLPRARVGPVVDRLAKGFRPPASGLVALDRRLASRPLIQRLRRAGAAVWCWTVDEPAQMRRLAALGVEGIISNRPALARATLRDSR